MAFVVRPIDPGLAKELSPAHPTEWAVDPDCGDCLYFAGSDPLDH